MSALTATSLQPFVPSGADYEGSRRLFKALGFEELWENNGMAGFRNGDARFLLQRFDNRAFAEQYMVAVSVPDLDVWWAAVSALELDKTFPGVRISPPKAMPWGREVSFIDLAGVCWHVMGAA